MHISRIFRPARLIVVLAASAALVGGFLLATAVLGQSSPSGLQIPVPLDPGPPEYRELAPGDVEFAGFLSGFSDFPLYWVGEEFGGHALDVVIRQVYSPEDGGPTQNIVKFLYGTCQVDISTEGGCSAPLQINIKPYCLVPPELIGDGARPDGIGKVRGDADAITVGGGLRIWTGDVTIKIYASTPQLLEDATAALVSPNGVGAVSAGSRLPAPAPDCSGYKTVPHPAG